MHAMDTELDHAPVFEPGDKVRALKGVRNDGTYPGVPMGGHLLQAGEIGYVKSVGTYLNRYWIYTVDFIGPGIKLGMRANELQDLEDRT